MYINNPMEIENKSMQMIEDMMEKSSYTDFEKVVVKRMIHTTGDVGYEKIVDFRGGFEEKALSVIKGSKIYTDTKMANAGINKSSAKKNRIELLYTIDDEEVKKLAEEKGTTRSYQAVEKAVREGADIFVFGNAPTALYRLIEMIDLGLVKPKLIVAVPVGFVGAAESKELIREKNYDIPLVSTIGNKGGSNVAASVINALMYMIER